MISLTTPNTNTVMPYLFTHLDLEGISDNYPTSPTIYSPGPVAIEYTNPRQRVHFCEFRDANPFINLAESLWMLAGREGSSMALWYLPETAGNREHLAPPVGARARNWGEGSLDQIARAAQTLANWQSQQAVVSLWSPERDLTKCAYNKVRNVALTFQCSMRRSSNDWHALDLHVFNRTDDIIWGGGSGVDMVFLSILLEYVAALAGMQTGRMHVYSASVHAHKNDTYFGPLAFRYLETTPVDAPTNLYESEGVRVQPLVGADERVYDFNDDLQTYLQLTQTFVDGRTPALEQYEYGTRFFRLVASPMLLAYRDYRAGRGADALRHVDAMIPCDWKLAARAWLERRGAND